jgi:hypothetical protein
VTARGNSYPAPIGDPRLTPELRRTRTGSTQAFAHPGKQSFEPDFTIEPPERHVFAELIDGKWCWVNGCDECHGREGTWITYIKCEKHDVCHQCKTPRAKLTATPWGHPKGFECKPCHETRRAIECAEALAKVGARPYDEWDYCDLSAPTCPYCRYEFEPDHSLYEAQDKVVTCERCDNKFEVSAETTVSFTSRRPESKDDHEG